ncbi:hypothetical protein ACOME3_001635 [Neoechinorhynchus agilis]
MISNTLWNALKVVWDFAIRVSQHGQMKIQTLLCNKRFKMDKGRSSFSVISQMADSFTISLKERAENRIAGSSLNPKRITVHTERWYPRKMLTQNRSRLFGMLKFILEIYKPLRKLPANRNPIRSKTNCCFHCARDDFNSSNTNAMNRGFHDSDCYQIGIPFR